jgi:hypothetical protein
MLVLFHGAAGGWDELLIAVAAFGVLWVAVKLAGRKSADSDEDDNDDNEGAEEAAEAAGEQKPPEAASEHEPSEVAKPPASRHG